MHAQAQHYVSGISVLLWPEAHHVRFFCNACVVISNKYLFQVYKFTFPFTVR